MSTSTSLKPPSLTTAVAAKAFPRRRLCRSKTGRACPRLLIASARTRSLGRRCTRGSPVRPNLRSLVSAHATTTTSRLLCLMRGPQSATCLTFYQERIANEAFLRTATERLSVLELARLINYELRPGVAAGTYLAFTIEDAPGAAGQVLAVGTSAQVAPEQLSPITISAGIKVQSIPGPGEQAQTFETVEEIQARPEWNAISPRLTQPQNNATFLAARRNFRRH